MKLQETQHTKVIAQAAAQSGGGSGGVVNGLLIQKSIDIPGAILPTVVDTDFGTANQNPTDQIMSTLMAFIPANAQRWVDGIAKKTSGSTTTVPVTGGSITRDINLPDASLDLNNVKDVLFYKPEVNTFGPAFVEYRKSTDGPTGQTSNTRNLFILKSDDYWQYTDAAFTNIFPDQGTLGIVQDPLASMIASVSDFDNPDSDMSALYSPEPYDPGPANNLFPTYESIAAQFDSAGGGSSQLAGAGIEGSLAGLTGSGTSASPFVIGSGDMNIWQSGFLNGGSPNEVWFSFSATAGQIYRLQVSEGLNNDGFYWPRKISGQGNESVLVDMQIQNPSGTVISDSFPSTVPSPGTAGSTGYTVPWHNGTSSNFGLHRPVNANTPFVFKALVTGTYKIRITPRIDSNISTLPSPAITSIPNTGIFYVRLIQHSGTFGTVIAGEAVLDPSESGDSGDSYILNIGKRDIPFSGSQTTYYKMYLTAGSIYWIMMYSSSTSYSGVDLQVLGDSHTSPETSQHTEFEFASVSGGMIIRRSFYCQTSGVYTIKVVQKSTQAGSSIVVREVGYVANLPTVVDYTSASFANTTKPVTFFADIEYREWVYLVDFTQSNAGSSTAKTLALVMSGLNYSISSNGYMSVNAYRGDAFANAINESNRYVTINTPSRDDVILINPATNGLSRYSLVVAAASPSGQTWIDRLAKPLVQIGLAGYDAPTLPVYNSDSTTPLFTTLSFGVRGGYSGLVFIPRGSISPSGTTLRVAVADASNGHGSGIETIDAGYRIMGKSNAPGLMGPLASSGANTVIIWTGSSSSSNNSTVHREYEPSSNSYPTPDAFTLAFPTLSVSYMYIKHDAGLLNTEGKVLAALWYGNTVTDGSQVGGVPADPCASWTSDTTVPAITNPTSAASVTAGAAFTISWTGKPGATGYQIQRAPSPAGSGSTWTTVVANTGSTATTTSYTENITGSFQYRVIGLNTGCSNSSPSAPSAVVAVGAGATDCNVGPGWSTSGSTAYSALATNYNGATTVTSGQNVTVKWTPVTGATYYDIYRLLNSVADSSYSSGVFVGQWVDEADFQIVTPAPSAPGVYKYIVVANRTGCANVKYDAGSAITVNAASEEQQGSQEAPTPLPIAKAVPKDWTPGVIVVDSTFNNKTCYACLLLAGQTYKFELRDGWNSQNPGHVGDVIGKMRIGNPDTGAQVGIDIDTTTGVAQLTITPTSTNFYFLCVAPYEATPPSGTVYSYSVRGWCETCPPEESEISGGAGACNCGGSAESAPMGIGYNPARTNVYQKNLAHKRVPIIMDRVIPDTIEIIVDGQAVNATIYDMSGEYNSNISTWSNDTGQTYFPIGSPSTRYGLIDVSYESSDILGRYANRPIGITRLHPPTQDGVFESADDFGINDTIRQSMNRAEMEATGDFLIVPSRLLFKRMSGVQSPQSKYLTGANEVNALADADGYAIMWNRKSSAFSGMGIRVVTHGTHKYMEWNDVPNAIETRVIIAEYNPGNFYSSSLPLLNHTDSINGRNNTASSTEKNMVALKAGRVAIDTIRPGSAISDSLGVVKGGSSFGAVAPYRVFTMGPKARYSTGSHPLANATKVPEALDAGALVWTEQIGSVPNRFLLSSNSGEDTGVTTPADYYNLSMITQDVDDRRARFARAYIEPGKKYVVIVQPRFGNMINPTTSPQVTYWWGLPSDPYILDGTTLSIAPLLPEMQRPDPNSSTIRIRYMSVMPINESHVVTKRLNADTITDTSSIIEPA